MPGKIVVPQEEIRGFCNRYHIRKLALFGSVLRDDFGPESDIDVLVEFEPDAGVGFFELYDMEEELSRLFGGRNVEIMTPRSLSKYFRDSVLRRAEVKDEIVHFLRGIQADLFHKINGVVRLRSRFCQGKFG
jgi:uncharacterized protein